jgi:acetyl esterase/lipase
MCRLPVPTLLALAALAGVDAAQAQSVPTHADLVYATVGGQPLRLDLYLPSGGTTPRPLLVWIHGGGWSSGNRFPAPSFAVLLRDRGFAVASVSYRLTSQAGQWGGEAVTFPAQIHDVKAAVRWLRAHAGDYQIDPQRVAFWGSSAGGHLAALAGTSGNDPTLEGSVGAHLGESSAAQVVVDYYGPTDLLQMNLDITTPPGGFDHDAPTSPESRLLGFDQPGEGIGVLRANLDNPNPPFPALALLAQQVNPITWVDAADPPFLIVHGDADTTVPYAQSLRLRDALHAAGHTPAFITVAGAGHGGFPGAVQAQAQGFILDAIGTALLSDGFEDDSVP